MRKLLLISFVIVIFMTELLTLNIYSGVSGMEEWRSEFLKGNFAKCGKILKERDLKTLSTDEKLFLAESLVRTGDHRAAEKVLFRTGEEKKFAADKIAVEAMLMLSEGRFVEARKKAESLIKMNCDSPRTIRMRIDLNLFLRDFRSAEELFFLLEKRYVDFSKTTLFHRIGIEIYKYDKNIKGLYKIYSSRIKYLKKRTKKRFLSNLKATRKLYKKKDVQTFFVESGRDSVELPFVKSGDKHENTVAVKIGGKIYWVLVDTGNMTGWMIHNRDLREQMKPEKGGRIVTKIGSESETMDGYSVFCKAVSFGDFKIKNLFGVYVPKPRSGFYDANLNPIYIKNRVTTLDFIRDRILFRTKERFEKDIKKKNNLFSIRVPWYGYRFPLIPVIIKGINGFAVIETGAEDISVKLDVAKKLNLPLTPRTKYLSNGRKFNYFICPVEVQLGKYLFVRRKTEVWPLGRFANGYTGFSPDVVLGPEAFKGKFSVSFLPGKSTMVFQYEKK